MAASRPVRRKAKIPSPWVTERPKREALRTKKRQAIMRAAAVCFSSRGIDATTMDDVAAMLGVTKPTIYRLFRDKTALVEACQEKAASLFVGLFNEARALKGTAFDRLKHYFTGDLHLMCEDDFCRMLLPPGLNDVYTQSSRHFVRLREQVGQGIREILQDGIDRGEFDKSLDPKLMELALFSTFNFVARWFNPRGTYTLNDIADQYFRMFLKGIRAGS